MKPLKTVTIAVLLLATAAAGLLPAAAQARTADRARTELTVRHRPQHRDRAAARVRTHHAPNYAWQLFRATNESRRRHGLGRLDLNRQMSDVARRHSAAMARANRLYHSTDIGRYLNGNGVGRWSIWGENIGWTTGNVKDLQRAFMASAVHRVHILSRSFRHVAVGAVQTKHKLWVTVFFYG